MFLAIIRSLSHTRLSSARSRTTMSAPFWRRTSGSSPRPTPMMRPKPPVRPTCTPEMTSSINDDGVLREYTAHKGSFFVGLGGELAGELLLRFGLSKPFQEGNRRDSNPRPSLEP